MAKSFDKSSTNLTIRVKIAFIATILCFSMITVRLWYLQILKGQYFRERSENNRIRTVYVPPPRGLIVARGGEVIVKNRPAFNIELVTEDSPNPKKTLADLARLLGYPEEEIVGRIKDQRSRRRFEPKLILKDISRELVAKVAAHRHALPGIIINVVPARHYVNEDLAAHVVGYIREITREQLDKPNYAGYRAADLIGQYGIEAKWEQLLKGERGVQAVVVNAAGTRIGEASYEPETAGSTVTLTIDYQTQLAADTALKAARGAIVAIEPRTGEILALSSSPRFDPNMFIREVTTEQWRDLTAGRDLKLINRAIQGTYPPASTFKIIVGAAGIAEGVIGPQDKIFCPGHLTFGSRNYRCHKRSGHGAVNFAEAMAQSCDVYFYTIGQRLGVDRIHDYSRRFGLGEVTGLGLLEEVGEIPSTEWKRRRNSTPETQKWYPGETLSVAIGQGALTVTPLQLARAVAALVNGGKVLQPALVKDIVSPDGRVPQFQFEPKFVRSLDLDKSVIKVVREGLIEVVKSAQGTGRRASLKEEFGISVAGKTGTAQVVSLDLGSKAAHHEDHAWFVGYAPEDNPQIVVAALVENGGHGGVVAAPMAKQVMEAFFLARGVKRKGPDVAAVAVVPAVEGED